MHVVLNTVFRFVIPFILVLFGLQFSAHADAWLIHEGEYKLSGSYMGYDKGTRKYIGEQRLSIEEIETKMLILGEKKSEKDSLIKKLNKNGGSSKRLTYELRKIEHEIEELKQEKANIIALDDLKLASLGIIYGTSENTNIGVQINYEFEKLFQKELSGKDFDFRLFYKLIEYDQYVLTIAPELKYSNSYLGGERWSAGGGVYIGHSGHFTDITGFFSEIGVVGSRVFTKGKARTHQVGLSLQEGVNINSDLLIYNYQFFERVNDGSEILDITYFEQFSVAKEIRFGKLVPAVTISLGYFWKGSFKHKYDPLSGPIISLWSTF